MKKRKILYLFPLTALLLSGCSFAEFKSSVKQSWVGQHILSPVLNWIRGGDGGKEEQPSGGETDVTVRSIIIESYREQVPQGYEYKISDVSIRVYYTDGTEATKEPESVKCDTSKVGETTLTVTYKGAVKEATVTVLDESQIVHVESIYFNVDKRTLHVGETAQITVTFDPVDATDQSLTFVSSDDAVLTVSSSGLVEGIAVGSATVTITSNDNPEAKKEVTFTVAEEAASLPEATAAGYQRLAAGETLLPGEKINVAGAIGSKYYVMPQYSSNNNIKAKEVELENGQLVIAEDDQFTVIDNGDGTIALMQDDGKYLSACGDADNKNYLRVTGNIDATAKFSYSVDANGNAQLQAKGVNRGYLCLNPNAQNGQPLFSCYRSADYEKYAIYHDGNGSTAHVDVESVSFADEEVSVEIGSTINVIANVSPALASDKQVIYEIQSGAEYITLEGSVVTGVAEGDAVILAKSHENEEITDTITVHVIEHIERNYGTLENPLSIAQAKAVIDLDGGKPAETMYVTGKVKNNDAYNSTYKNTNVWLTDGVNEFELYGALMPEGFEPAQPAKNDPALVGKKVVAHGTGKIYGTTYEFDKNCQIDSVTDEEVPVVTITGLIEGSATGIPGTIEQGNSLKVENISVGVYLSDGSDGVTHPDSIELSTEALGVVGGKLIVGEFEYEFTIEVIAKVERNYGTLENPLTVSEALALITDTCKNDGDVTEQQIYCEGTVSEKGTEKDYGYQNVHVSDGESDILIYSLNMTAEQKAVYDLGKVIKFHGYAKNYKGTLEFASKGSDYVTVDEIVVEAVPVESITLSPSVLALEKGKAGATLTAEVLPENATDKSLTWTSGNEEVATVSDSGVVTAVGEGQTTITATAKDGSGVFGTCAVTVTVPEVEVELTSIEITGDLETSEYVEGTNYDPAGLVVTAYYSDETSEDITASEDLQWTITPATATVGDEEVTFAASYKGQEDSVALPVSVSVAKGTLDHPYTVAEARAAIDSGEGIANVYATGIVSEIVTPYNDGYHNVSFNISADGSKSADQLQGYRTVASSADDIEVGDTVVLYGTLKKYNSTYEFDSGNTVVSNTKATVESVVISGTPSQTTYTEGSAYNHNGLVATAHLDVGLDIDVTELASWEPSKATAEEGDELLSFVATYKEVPSDAFEYPVEVTTDVVPTEKVVYTLDGTVTGGTSGYAEASEITQSGVVWSVEGNTTMNPWRIGGKNLSGVDRVAKSTQAVTSDDLSKVSVTTGTKTLSAVNSITIKVGSTEGASDLGSQTFTTGLISSTLEFERPSNADWSNAFITVVFNVNAAGSNQYIQLIAINLYAVK